MFDHINEEEFYNEYYELLINRVTHSTMSLEKDLGNPDDSKNAIRLRDNMRAFKYLLGKNNEALSEQVIINTANMINASSMYISNGYRSTGKCIAESDIPISNPENIEYDMKNLLNDYYHNWKDMNPYEREARFHIQFIKIHPFEDGNGRTARLILNASLLKQNLAPVIITEDLDEYYKSYIRDESVEGMTNLFKIQAQKEKFVFDELQKEYYSNLENIEKGFPLK